MITVEDLDAKEEYKQVKITPKFIIWTQCFGEHHLICLGHILHTTTRVYYFVIGVFDLF